MNPYYNYENKIILYHGDCLEVMKQFKENSIDMILCDLPYGITGCDWDILIDLNKLWIQYERIIKNNNAIILFGKQPFSTDLINSNRKLFRYELIWNKKKGSAFMLAYKMPMQEHENILLFYKHLPVYNPIKLRKKHKNTFKKNNYCSAQIYPKSIYPRIDKNKKGKNQNDSDYKFPGSIIDIKKQQNSNNQFKKEEKHSSEKPIELCKYLIQTYSNKNMIILDNCAGYGSTGIASLQLDRSCIMIEKEKKFCDIIIKRLKHAIAEKENEFYIPEEENLLFK